MNAATLARIVTILLTAALGCARAAPVPLLNEVVASSMTGNVFFAAAGAGPLSRSDDGRSGPLYSSASATVGLGAVGIDAHIDTVCCASFAEAVRVVSRARGYITFIGPSGGPGIASATGAALYLAGGFTGAGSPGARFDGDASVEVLLNGTLVGEIRYAWDGITAVKTHSVNLAADVDPLNDPTDRDFVFDFGAPGFDVVSERLYQIEFVISERLAASGNNHVDIDGDFGHTFRFSDAGPVFGLPAGWTAQSTEFAIVGNRYCPTGCAPAGIPEPSSAWLVACALLALPTALRRRHLQALHIALGLVVAGLATASTAATVTLDVHALPSTQGWTYDSQPGSSETDHVLLRPVGLTYTNLGLDIKTTGGVDALVYERTGDIEASARFELTTRVRILPRSNGRAFGLLLGDGHRFAEIEFDGRQLYAHEDPFSFRMLTDAFAIGRGDFHDLRLVGDFAAGAYEAYIDGEFAGSASMYPYTVPPPTVSVLRFGFVDITSTIAEVDVASLELRTGTPVPEPTSAWLLVSVAGLLRARPSRPHDEQPARA